MSAARGGTWVDLCSPKGVSDEGLLELKKVQLTRWKGEKHSGKREGHVQRSWERSRARGRNRKKGKCGVTGERKGGCGQEEVGSGQTIPGHSVIHWVQISKSISVLSTLYYLIKPEATFWGEYLYYTFYTQRTRVSERQNNLPKSLGQWESQDLNPDLSESSAKLEQQSLSLS